MTNETTSHVPDLTPLNGHLLVQLGTKYKHVAATTKAYEAKNNGIVIAISQLIYDKQDIKFINKLFGSRVYWQDYKEGSTLTVDGIEYAFVKYDDIQGFSNA